MQMSGGIHGRLYRTWQAIMLTGARRDTRVVFGVVSAGYLLAYLYAIQDLRIRPDMDPGIVLVDRILHTAVQRTGPASFERVAMIDTGFVRLLFSPGNLTIGLVLAILVGISIALTYLALVQPKACGIGSGTGILAAIPALLGGSVCCAPVLVLVLGIQMTSVTLTVFTWLLPFSVLLLIGTLIYLGGKIQID